MALTSPSFVIEAHDVQQLLLSSNLSIEAFLTTLVAPTQALARPPISQYFVGAVGLGASGRVFRGVNLEFVGLPLCNSVHAEQFLVANAAQNGEQELRFIAVSAAPCGHCRQFLQELRGAPELRVLIADAKAETQTLSHFLPHRFGPNDVLQGEFPLLLEPRANGLSLMPDELGSSVEGNSNNHCSPKSKVSEIAIGRSEVEQSSVCDGMSGLLKDTNGVDLRSCAISGSAGLEENFASEASSEICDSNSSAHCGRQGSDGIFSENSLSSLKLAALEAANSSHAPYTDCPSGIALLTRKGKIYSGCYKESVAHNPSLPPLQAALVAFVSRDGGRYEDIVQAVLVEKKGAVMQFAATARLLMEKISPNCIFHLCHAVME